MTAALADTTTPTTAPGPELLAYEQEHVPLTALERVLAVGMAGPWIAAATGWSVCTGAHHLLRWARR